MTGPAASADPWALSALHLYAQVSVGLALYLYGAVSTPAWLSVLIAAGPLTLLALLLRRGAARGQMPRRLAWLPGIACLLDGLYAFFALCSLLRDLAPDLDVRIAAPAYGLILGVALLSAPDRDALPRLGRLALPALGVLLLFCLLCVPGRGRFERFFPLLGFGPLPVLRGALWVFGASATALTPLLSPGETPGKALSRLLPALLFASVTAAAAAWLLPARALCAPRTAGWRLMLISHTTPSVPCWSAQAAALLLLLMLSLCTGVRRGVALLAGNAGKTGKENAAAAVLLLLAALFAAFREEETKALLLGAGPWRAAPVTAAAAWLCLRRKEKE